MINLKAKKQLAARVIGVGVHRIRFDPDHHEDIEEAITRANIRSLVTANTIKIKKFKGTSRGKVTTYGELAKAAGIKNGQRAVGNFMNKNPYPVIIPCHRVVMSDGSIGGYMYGKEIKIKMLRDEGIEINNNKIVNWDKHMYRF